ncbi:MAG: tRNA (adenosine(37)-N6)-threonylcarbamoyltransferase complex ATPase subunit type 1 TsaE [Fervidobacterium sp.]
MEKGNELCIDLGILNQEELTQTGEMIANGLSEGDIIILSGEIGSGKTTFTRGIVKGLGCDPVVVTSPTFTLMNVYVCSKTVFHIDAYRLGSIDETFQILENELEDEDGIFIIEWGERLKEFFKNEVISVYFEHVDEFHRKVSICARKDVLERIGRCLEIAKKIE